MLDASRCMPNNLFCIVVRRAGAETEGGDKLNEIPCMIYGTAGLYFIYLYSGTPQKKPIFTSPTVPE